MRAAVTELAEGCAQGEAARPVGGAALEAERGVPFGDERGAAGTDAVAAVELGAVEVVRVLGVLLETGSTVT